MSSPQPWWNWIPYRVVRHGLGRRGPCHCDRVRDCLLDIFLRYSRPIGQGLRYRLGHFGFRQSGRLLTQGAGNRVGNLPFGNARLLFGQRAGDGVSYLGLCNARSLLSHGLGNRVGNFSLRDP
ncbi:MAG: hypothetical protein OXC95_05885 [Dehalococcoidia bacterium]|nr:hypothetical protein [Dehalococcoidia bacterium]